MPDVNFEWVRQQLEEAKAKVGSGNAVIRLLETWEQISKISPAMAEEAIQIFSKLALGKPVFTPDDPADEVWIPLQPGNIVVGDEVRVLSDAFSDKTGIMHNGRRGKVIAIRYGDVIFKATDGKSPELNGVHYSPYKLEKKVK